MAVFWVVAPCSLVEVSEVLAAYIIRMIALMIKAASTFWFCYHSVSNFTPKTRYKYAE
jgi:hypothetical protein